MKISVLTIFPEAFDSFMKGPVISRCLQKNLAEIEIVDIRSFADGSFRHIDESPYGGGAGMIMRCEPVIKALRTVKTPESRTIAFSPCGISYNQKKAHEYAGLSHLILLCGHYEGMDERIYDEVDEQISMGDYILTGGEIPSMTVIDSIARLLKGALRKESTEEESFENDLLEYPQYTRPADFEGKKVPQILLSGDHEAIHRWRLEQSLKRTAERRPDLLEHHRLTEEEKSILKKENENE